MLRANVWNKSVPWAEIDQRVRDARLRLQRLERLLVPRAPVTPSWLTRAFCLFGFGGFGRGVRGYRIGRPLRHRRPSRMPQIHRDLVGVYGSC
jgi:hypothetical protein